PRPRWRTCSRLPRCTAVSRFAQPDTTATKNARRHKKSTKRRGFLAGRFEGRARPPGAPRSSRAIFTSSFAKATEDRDGRKGHEETGVGLHQISAQALFLFLMTETTTALRDLLLKPFCRMFIKMGRT